MKKLFLFLWLAVSAGLPCWTSSVAAGDAELVFDDPWVRAMPPGMKMTAGFGRLRNTGSETIELVAFASPAFGEVSLHRTEIIDGVNRMREVPALAIAAGETLALEPGGYHLMLMMPSEPLAPGQRVSLDMVTGDGRAYRFEVPVERR